MPVGCMNTAENTSLSIGTYPEKLRRRRAHCRAIKTGRSDTPRGLAFVIMHPKYSLFPGRKVHYQRNYLSQVILRLDFEPVSALRELKRVDTRPDFSTLIGDRFPVVIGQPTANLVVNVGPTGSGINTQVTGIQWNHRKKQDGTQILVLSPDFLSLEYGKRSYDHFPPFRDEFLAAFQALQALYNVSGFTRLGLRYINEVVLPEGNALDWRNIIAPHLVEAVMANRPENSAMLRSMHQLLVRIDECDLTCTYGLHNPDFPNPVVRRAFILDIDCARTTLDAQQIVPTIGIINKLCEEAFERSIANGLRESLGVINEVA